MHFAPGVFLGGRTLDLDIIVVDVCACASIKILQGYGWLKLNLHTSGEDLGGGGLWGL